MSATSSIVADSEAMFTVLVGGNMLDVSTLAVSGVMSAELVLGKMGKTDMMAMSSSTYRSG